MLCAYGRYKAEIITGEDALKGCRNRGRIVAIDLQLRMQSVYILPIKL